MDIDLTQLALDPPCSGQFSVVYTNDRDELEKDGVKGVWTSEISTKPVGFRLAWEEFDRPRSSLRLTLRLSTPPATAPTAPTGP